MYTAYKALLHPRKEGAVNSSTLAEKLLGVGNVPFGRSVAVELLSTVPGDHLPNHLINSAPFNGPDAIKVALSSTAKARIIAANTTDAQVQRALFTHENTRVVGVNAMLEEGHVEDEDLLDDIHQLVWETDVDNAAYISARHKIVHYVPVATLVRFLTTSPAACSYDVAAAGRRIGRAIADHDRSAVPSIDPIARALGTLESRRNISEDFLSGVGHGLAWATRDGALSDHLCVIDSTVERKHGDVIIPAAVTRAAHIDARSLGMYIARGTGTPSQVSAMLRLVSGRLSYDAIETLAQTYPGALLTTVERLSPNDGRYGAVVDIALSANRWDLAFAVVNRQPQVGETKGSNLSVEQFRRAIDLCQTGEFYDEGTRARAEVHETVMAAAIPREATVSDVLAAMRVVKRRDAFVSQFVCPRSSERVQWTVTASDMTEMIGELTRSERTTVQKNVLHSWCYYTLGGDRDDILDVPEHLEAVVSVVANSVPARELTDSRDGILYIGRTLVAALGDDVPSWRTAMGLIPHADVPLDAVINAARRLRS